MARGLYQKEGEDYDEMFSPVSRYTVRSIISTDSSMRWNLHQMDVKTNFINEIIEEEVYIEHSQGFEVHGKESHFCKLKIALYGINKAPRAWYSRIHNYLTRFGFSKSSAHPNHISRLRRMNLLFYYYMLMNYF